MTYFFLSFSRLHRAVLISPCRFLVHASRFIASFMRISTCRGTVYTKSPLKSNPHGIIKANNGVAGIVSTLYAVYKPLAITSSLFVQYYFELDIRLNSYLKPLVNKGAKNDMKVSDDNALLGEVVFPSREEQDAIATLLSGFDEQIANYFQKVEWLQKLKSVYLQKMFI